MKILIDMNLPPRLATKLTAAGIDAIHWFSVGAPNATDKEIISYAQEKDYVLMTCDLDFSAILSFTAASKPSLIQLRLQCVELDRDVPVIILAILQRKEALKQGAILTIDINQRRLRLLPLQIKDK